MAGSLLKNPDKNKTMWLEVFVYIFVVGTVNGLYLSTYNVWNTMFNWHVRKQRITEMIHTTESDVIALQEVRSSNFSQTTNQIVEIMAALPSQYKWHIFRVANNVTFLDKTIDKGYPGEGIGIISRLPIIDSSTHYLLPHPRDPDKNRRVIVHAKVKDRDGMFYDILVVHLSYYRQQQCRNMADIATFIKKRGLQNIVILGDFNTYIDYNWPVQIFLDGKVTKDNPCWKAGANIDLSGLKFKDAWLVTHQDENGFTFSNMPTPGFESRPDRILVESSLKVNSVRLIGDGARFKQRYTAAVHWSRFTTIIQSAYLTYKGVSGYACKHDCGPHGSCQCGVCAAVGNKQNCFLPDCHTCNTDIFKSLVINLLLFTIILFHLFYSVILILTIGTNSYNDTLYSVLGFKCCLFNPQLCRFNTRSVQRKLKLLKICKLWPLFWLPPYVQFVGNVLVLIFLYLYTKYTFKAVLDLTYNTLAEELFPSDHLMVVAEVVK